MHSASFPSTRFPLEENTWPRDESTGMISKTARAASAFKTGFAYGGSALLSGVNAITPHLAGAVDIMVVEQPDMTYRSSPFYVRFGKYTHLRNKDRVVQIFINDEPAPFHMELGPYGQACFPCKNDTGDLQEDRDIILADMMSPRCEYSSADDREELGTDDGIEEAMSDTCKILDRKQSEEMEHPGLLRKTRTAPLPGGTDEVEAFNPRPGFSRSLGKESRVQDHACSTTSGFNSVSQVGTRYLHPETPLGNKIGSTNFGAIVSGLNEGSSHETLQYLAQHEAQDERPNHFHGEHPRTRSVPGNFSPGCLISGSSRCRFEQGTPGRSFEDDGSLRLTHRDKSDEQCSSERLVSSKSAQSSQANAALPDGSFERKLQKRTLEQVGPLTPGTHYLSYYPNVDRVLCDKSEVPRMANLCAHFSQTRESNMLDDEASGTAHGLSCGGERAVAHPLETESNISLVDSSRSESAFTSGGLLRFENYSIKMSRADTPTEAVCIDRDPSGSSERMGRTLPACRSPSFTYSTSSNDEASAEAEPGPLHASGLRQPRSCSLLPEQHSVIVATKANDAYVQGKSPQDFNRTLHCGEVACDPGSRDHECFLKTLAKSLELSTGGCHLHDCTEDDEAQKIFDAHLIRPELFKAQGAQLLQHPDLVVRVGGVIYPWTAAAPMVIGIILYGEPWEHLVPPDAPRWSSNSRLVASISGNKPSQEVASRTPDNRSPIRSENSSPANCPAEMEKKAEAALISSWRFWPFTGWRERSPQQELRVPPETGSAAAGLDITSSRSSSPTRSLQGSRTASSAQEQQKVNAMTESMCPSPEQLAMLRLKEGQNVIKYKAGASELVAYIYFYRWCTKLVISDIDGTITKSDVLGHLLPAMGWDWSHPGITRLFTDITKNDYQVMYLSSRSISQANITRDYINTLVQGQHRMPVGPVIISPHGLLPSLYREMILRRPHEFKIATLEAIRALFPPEWNPFYAGFGNRDTDEISY